ncbi:MAG: chemotaxis protein CheA [Desulfobulbaceae bacterium A2]|nr:MAG: chemotaxis protein CheA [Desulfobulbaceae bacterium A2]
MSPAASSEDIEIIQGFIEETSEMIEQLEPTVIELGQIPQDGPDWLSTINSIFRLFHSMKGSAGFLEFQHIASAAHSAESLLDLIRSGKITLCAEHVDLFCQACDFAKEALVQVGEQYSDAGMAAAAGDLSARLKEASQRALGGTEAPPPAAAAAKTPADDPAVPAAATPAVTAPPAAASAGLEMQITPEMLESFVREGEDLLDKAEQGFLSWGEISSSPGVVSDLFRNIHSFKGNAGFFGYRDLERLAHAMETALDLYRCGEALVGEQPENVFLELIDVLRSAVTAIAGGAAGAIPAIDDHLVRLQGVTRAPLGEILLKQGVVSARALDQALHVQVNARAQGENQPPLGEVLVAMGQISEPQLHEALAQQGVPPPAGPAAAPPAARATEGGDKKKVVQRQDIRVDLDKLDSLINIIGEMVIAENMLVHNPDLQGLELENFNKAAQQMGKLVRELQEMAMTIRMIPVSGLFKRMIRLVHDLAAKSGKKVDLQLEGEQTELDKTVIETINDPLVHLLRNSMDHGLEPPEERRAAGKPEVGQLKLWARHEEGEVWITIEDDGRGLNRDKILAKALSKGLISGDGSDLADDAIYKLIFQPGFSTADKVTDISGRGVGMDVVKQNLLKIRGKVDVHSTPGRGSRIDLRIPLTLAIIDGMLVRVGGAKCILPILAIRESFCPQPDDVTVTPDRQELIQVRDTFYPALRLHDVLGHEPDSRRLEDGILVVLENHGSGICLLVDEILGQQQTVIKGLSKYIGTPAGISGCTILGNGEVCLIADVGGLVDMVR